MPVRPHPLPDDALLNVYARDGRYADCFVTDIPRSVSHAQFVAAFYTTTVFKLERWILKLAVARPSTDEQARQLAAGELEQFAAWSVENRAENQLLLCDLYGRTRSWLMVAPLPDGAGTRLYFGSAVVPVIDRKTGRSSMGTGHSALLSFHKLYSRVLLGAAARRLR